MKIDRVLACGLLLACSSASLAYPRYSPVAAQLLEAHNVERRAIGAAPLVWDARLAAAADAYALQLARTGRWGHSAPHQRAGQGENLWMGTRGAFSATHMVRDWASERRAFRPGVFPNVSRSGSCTTSAITLRSSGRRRAPSGAVCAHRARWIIWFAVTRPPATSPASASGPRGSQFAEASPLHLA